MIQDLDGDGVWQTGWSILYMHMDTQDRVSVGTYVEAGIGLVTLPVKAVSLPERTCILPEGIMENGSQPMETCRLLWMVGSLQDMAWNMTVI